MKMKTLTRQNSIYLGLFLKKLTQEQHDNILKWIDALESGKYEQGKGQLVSGCETKYCCLGVANTVCDLRNAPHGIRLARGRLKMGLATTEGNFNMYPFGTEALTTLNDKEVDSWSFKEIANLLRDQLKFSEVKK